MIKNRGFSSIALIIIIIVLVLGGGYWVWQNRLGSPTSKSAPAPVNDTNIEPPVSSTPSVETFAIIKPSVSPIVFPDGEEWRVLDWLAYSNLDLGFLVNYPSPLELVDREFTNQKFTASFLSPQVSILTGQNGASDSSILFGLEKTHPFFSVRVITFPSKTTNEEMKKQFEFQSEHYYSYNIKTGDVIIDGVTGVYNKYYNPNETPSANLSIPETETYIVMKNNRIYSIEFYPKKGWGKWTSAILSTFRFIK